MDQNLTYIAILLDRSGSMGGSEADVIGGVNTFLAEQRRVPGKALLTIARFDQEFETIMEDVDLSAARNLVGEDFVPRGMTALNDSLGRLIGHVGAKLAAMPEEKRPHQVHFLVFSDGHENTSKEFSGARIKTLVQEQQEKYSWKFLFFGMGIDGLGVGATVGVKGLSATKSGGGILRSAKAASAYVGTSRMGHHDMAEQVFGSNHVDDQNVRGVVDSYSRLLDEADKKQPSGKDSGT